MSKRKEEVVAVIHNLDYNLNNSNNLKQISSNRKHNLSNKSSPLSRIIMLLLIMQIKKKSNTFNN